MSVNEHGGYCCGISHVYDFPPAADETWLNREINDAISDIRGSWEDSEGEDFKGNFGHLIEVALTDSQMEVWAPTLKKKGFKLAHRFRNSNSGNVVNVLTYATRRAGVKRPWSF